MFSHQRPDMLLFFILGFLCANATEQLVEEAQIPYCNCTRLLHEEETSTEPSPTFPTTSFTCWGRYDGYYADIEVDCTIFHYCQTWQFPTGLNETVKWDFACPQSTIFNQKILSCTPPSISFDCQESPNYFWVNYNLTSTTTASTPVTEFSTPIPNFGQQLIVGGLKSETSSESAYLPSQRSITNPNLLHLESGSGSAQPPSKILNKESESVAINFPL